MEKISRENLELREAIKRRTIELEQKKSKPVYFDQGSSLIKKFKIKALPAVVSQEGEVLKVEEIPML